jgi:hypothetical protein
MLLNLYKSEEKINFLSRSPEEYLNKIAKPIFEEDYINWKMNNNKANFLAKLCFNEI